MKQPLQVSIRELMFIVFVAALGLAGLLTGGWMASLFVLLVIAAATALTIVAFVGNGRLRLFAIGFLVPLIYYAGSHAYVGSTELDPYGKFPTTKLIQPMYEVVVRREYIDINTGQPVPDYDPQKYQGLAGGAFALPVSVSEAPERTSFMTVAHALLAIVCGYVGGKFALWISCRSPSTAVV